MDDDMKIEVSISAEEIEDNADLYEEVAGVYWDDEDTMDLSEAFASLDYGDDDE